MIRRSTAVWNGTGSEGKGMLTSTSGVLQETPYSFSSRFQSEDGKAGTNPEELIAAAHAGCFTMALSFQLTEAGFVPDELRTEASIRVEKGQAGFEIQSIELKLQRTVPNIDNDKFQELAQAAKENCPVSKALGAVPITLQASLS